MFIVIEGPDGAGKTSQSKALAAALTAEWMCFPDRRTYFGKLVDGWLKGLWRVNASLRGTESELIASGLPGEREIDAAIFQAIQTVNRLELAERLTFAKAPGVRLVCDRYWMSGCAYGSADGLDPELLTRIHKLLPEPDLCILLDVDQDGLTERMGRRGNEAKRDLYEHRGAAYFQKVSRAYDQLWKLRSEDPRWMRLCVHERDPFEVTHGRLRAIVEAHSRG